MSYAPFEPPPGLEEEFKRISTLAQELREQALNPFECPSFRIEVDGSPTLASAVAALAVSVHQVAEAIRMNALAATVAQSACQASVNMGVSHSDLLDAASAWAEGWKNIVDSIKTGDFQASTTGDFSTSTTGDFTK